MFIQMAEFKDVTSMLERQRKCFGRFGTRLTIIRNAQPFYDTRGYPRQPGCEPKQLLLVRNLWEPRRSRSKQPPARSYAPFQCPPDRFPDCGRDPGVSAFFLLRGAVGATPLAPRVRRARRATRRELGRQCRALSSAAESGGT